MKKLVMIGNGMAGVRTIEEILKLSPNQFEITIFGQEPYPNYNRIKLSNILQGDTSFEEIIINPLDWYKENKIQLFTGEAVTKVDVEAKKVISDQGREVEYDELIIATGSNSFILPIPGADKIGVTGFRNIKDCEMMIKSAQNYNKAMVIGGGLLGLEAARGLLNLGMKVDVVHLMPNLMERQLDPIASSLLKAELESQGMRFLMEKETVEIIGDERVAGLRFKDGSLIPADLVVMAIGIKSNTMVAKESGIYVNRGIVVNDLMETSAPNVYAVGECAEHREIVYGLVAPLYEQGKVLAERICGKEAAPYEGSVTGTQLKVAGVDLYSAGEIFEDGTTKSIMVYNEYEGIYKRVLVRDNRIVGIVLYGDTKDSTRLFRMLSKKEDITGISIFESQCSAEGGSGDIASMPNDELVCGCNGVTKGAIVEAINAQGLTTLDQVSHCTNAGRSCGRCKPMVNDILAYTLGDQFDAAAAQKTSICGCTTISREELIAEIKEKGLTSVKEVMNVLEWNNEEGCTKCRPAINYYLGMIHMDEYLDDRDSRLVNEKMHANIQKDGTYSVVPRMYGGVTTAADLKRIAEVAEKYEVPLVKLTGGQRIGLFGLKKEDLPSMWKELDMPSGYAYGKTLRTVKTCVGAQFCRYGTQDSMSLGIELEKKFERLDTPHKVKMGVSACPRNCSEAGIKDIGFVGIDGGWEIYVAGNGGVDLRAGDLLATVKTEAEVMELTGAYLQYYRETANYLERTSKWVERVGLERVREVLANAETRKELNERMDQTLKKYIEPWNEAIECENIKDKYYAVQRTVYRDVEHLSAAGVPVLTERGRNGDFRLLDGWRTRLTGMTPAEAQAAFMLGLPGPASELGLGESLTSAQLKLLAALPADWQADALRVSSRFHLDPRGWYHGPEDVRFLAAAARAVWGERRVRIRYESWKGVADHELEPLGLVLKAGTWYLIARAGSRPRTYRLSNIQQLEETDRAFVRPRDFDLAEHWAASTERFERELYRESASVRASPRGLERLRRLSAAVAEAVDRAKGQPDATGWLRLSIPIESVDHAAREMLKVSPEVQVLKPRALRERMRDLAQRIAKLHSSRA